MVEKSMVCIEGWSRLREVLEYADRQGVSLEDAVQRLVNHGLSHPVCQWPSRSIRWRSGESTHPVR